MPASPENVSVPFDQPNRDTHVGPYVLSDRLGAGGMGAVFLGKHVELGAHHAVKIIQPDDPEVLLRFQREGEAQAALSGHPNVARVHTLGLDRGRFYLAMELLEGGDLDERLRREPMAPEEAARLIRDLAHAVAHAHEHGVLHRDLKPANVMFAADGAPKLVDFGLAALAGADSLTQSGAVLGTPAYMAPEQAGGRLEGVGPGTDVYGLGAVLYHCLTGGTPFGSGGRSGGRHPSSGSGGSGAGELRALETDRARRHARALAARTRGA